MTSVFEKDLSLKITFKGLPQSSAIYGKNTDSLLDPKNFEKFLEFKLWVPKRLKEKFSLG